ncbi:hypothetical protein BK133_27540 [Paenibacillus sp. FSL H8-0548]|uniref:adenylate/guanylate cyclase domain-containing protein n=1 Tax=Paenibacillus sp. FSL H8-0548 TaxID=1920422 RepID=UPI00096F15C7|nr:adenylate/guanylate cyclase domain-containing protein [Paenibacillus sp. FSL H8-0548]OMF21923.1 hypothetical protein BK133_27540 [Paenibacillus sp. FSL H8-0548]
MLRTKLIMLFSLILVAVILLVAMRDSWTLQPFKIEEPYSNISRITTDSDGSLYTITDSKKVIHKVNKDGKMVYSYSSSNNTQSDTVQLFNSIAADTQGNAYALITVLDSYGLKVSGEQIVRISADGSKSRILYYVDYEEQDQLLRVGKLQSLSIEDNELYFFRKEEGSATLLKLMLDESVTATPETITTVELPKDRYLNELTGNRESQFYFTSKRGTLSAVTSGEIVKLYPLSRDGQFNFPVGIVTSDDVNLYFIDYHDSAIKRLNTAAVGNPVEAVLTLDALNEFSPEVEWSDFTHISIGNGHIMVSSSDRVIQLNSNGAIVDVQDSYRYSYLVIGQRIGYWLLLLLLAVVVVYTIRFVYVNVMKRKVFLLLKQLAVILPVVLISMVGLSYSVYSSFAIEMKDDTYKQLRLLAGNGKYLVDGDYLEKLNSPLDYNSEDYNTIKQRVNEVFSRAGADRDGLYNTIYRYIDGGLYIVMDDDDSVTMFQPFEINDENRLVLEQGEIIMGEWEDSGGEWMYALGPLYNSNGDIIGIYETGKDMIGLNQSTMKILYEVLQIFAFIGIVLLMVITIMTAYLLSSIRTLRSNVNLIASGEWDVKVEIRTRDEVEELGERFNMMASSIKQYINEVTKLSNSYFRFVPQQFLKVLGKTNMTQIKLGEQQNRRMTIMVCNMRQFNEFSAKLSTEQNFKFINSFLKQFGPIIREHAGFTSRYLGPGMLTMFPNETSAALKAALQLRLTLESYNAERVRNQEEPIDIGIAIHSGDVMLGIIGEEQRMEGSVVSNHVELTLDLEKTSAKLGVTVLLTEDTMQALNPDKLGQYRRLGVLQIDEEHDPIELYDWYEADPEHIRRLKHETKKQFEAAVEAYRAGRFYDAREGFVAVVKKNRYDLAAKLYFFECDHYFQKGVTSEWNHSLRIS